MDFVAANFDFKNGKRIGNLCYRGNCVKSKDNGLIISESSDWRKFGKFDEKLGKCNVLKPIEYEDFYFLANYDIENNVLLMQTDLIAYEAVFIYNQGGIFAISDNVIALIKVLQQAGVVITINELLAKYYIAYNVILMNNTIFNDIFKLPAASIITYNLNTHILNTDIYNDFKMTGELKNTDECADVLYDSIDKYFATHIDERVEYSIGLSGGLDSRVGAYFGMKYNLNIQPIFMGIEKNKWGIRTYDSKRSEEVCKYLKMKKVKYYDPRKWALEKKVKFDALHATTMIDNVAQNLGKIEDIDVLINGIIGGDAFGYFVRDVIFDYDDDKLAEFILNNQVLIPEYKSQFLRRVGKAIPHLKVIKQLNKCSENVANELLSISERESAKKRIYDWVLEERKKGLDNLNIWHKFYYYNYGAISKTSYYSSLSNTVPSLPTFLNPIVLRNVILKSDTNLYKQDMPIQLALFKKLGALGDIRSQKPEESVNARRDGKEGSKILYILERAVRGTGMDYPKWFSKRKLKQYLIFLSRDTVFSSKIKLSDPAWLNNDQHAFLCLIKIAWIEKYILKLQELKDFNREE